MANLDPENPAERPVLPAAPPVDWDSRWAVERSRRAPPKPILAFGKTLSWLLAITALVLLLSALAPDILGLPAFIMTLVCAVVTIIWLWRARSNVEGLGGQRRSKGWVIWGWFCPVVNLWFPLQIVEDVAKIDNPVDRPRAGALTRYAWWACWHLSWLTALYVTWERTEYADGGFSESVRFGVDYLRTGPSRIFAAAAALLLALVVREISSRQELRPRS